MMLYVYIRSMVGKVYKILPLKEEFDAGEDTHFKDYINSLCADAMGALETFPELRLVPSYITVLNSLQFLNINEFDHHTCKREVFKMIRLLQKLEHKMGGNCNGC